MGMYSEKLQRAVDKYCRSLVRRQPIWLRDLFDTQRVNFFIEPTGELKLEMREDLDAHTKERACFLVSKYLARHPADFLQVTNIQ